MQPHPRITAPSERRRARLALALLLGVLGLGALDLSVSLGGGYGELDHDVWVESASVAATAAAYALVRSGRVTLGVALAIFSIQASIWHFRVDATAGAGETTVLQFLAVPILLAGLLLRLRPAVLLAAVTILAALGGEAYLDRASALGLDTEDFGMFLLLLAVAVLSIAAAALNERDALLLQETTELLQQVTDNIPEVLFVVAADGSRVHYTSPAYATVTGRSVEQSMADPGDWLKVVHPDDLPAVQAGLARGDPEMSYRIVHPSGAVKHLRARTFPVLGPGGKPTRIVGIAEDVTAVVRAQEAVRESQQKRIRLLQQLAHDLASPLSPVRIQLRLLRDRVAPEGQKGLDIVQRNVDHLQRLVQDVKDVARVEGGDLRIDRKPTDLAVLARQAADSLAPAAAERGVHVAVEAADALPAVLDPGRITQVLYNLVSNALKFTPPGGRIDVRLRRLDGHAEVQVADTGAGMRPDQVALLFQPFVQVHDAAAVKRPEDKGSGLGLYISKGIVEAHGGAIAAASGGPGQGSTFTFRLPLAAPADGRL